jgi:hypothetical protein
VIVARDREPMYAQLATIFADSPSVRVIVDRRQPDAGSATPARDRRVNQIDAQLRLFGWSIVTTQD